MSLLLTVLAFATIPASLPSVLDMGIPCPSTSARGISMGESGFVELTPTGALRNPALSGLLGPGLLVEVSGGTRLTMEKRLRKVYDEFGSSIGESEEAFNRHISTFPGGVSATGSGAVGIPNNVSITAGLYRPYSFCYDYDRMVMDESYVETARERLEVSGRASELALAACFAPSERLLVGLGAGYLFGNRTSRWVVSYVDPTADDVLQVTDTDVSGASARASALYRAGRVAISAGMDYSLSYELTGDEQASVSLPPVFHAGAVYEPGNALRTVFTGECYYSARSDAEREGADMYDRDAWGMSAGVENDLPGGPVGRFGFSYRSSPISRALDRMAFTLGLGFRLGDYSLDVGGSFSPGRWRQVEVPDMVSFDPGDSLVVEESSTTVLLSIGRRFEL
ncbi:hypothetical protein GF402_00750 [Candidatus Fermentibacteria bacterium]|nr:hypothetical protein [Candidatus Fermentibacteria bacterium]